MNLRTAKYLAISAALLSVVASAGADVIRNPGAMSLGASIQTFETMSIGILGNTFTTGSMTFSSANGLAITSIANYPANGTAVTNNILQGVGTINVGPGAEYGSMTIEFENPVAEVLLGWFDPNFEGNLLQAFNSDGVMIDEAAVDLGPIGGWSASWIGFTHTTADIKSVRLIDPSADDVYGIDNIQTVVPAPAAGLAMILAGGAAVRRRRR